MTNAEGEIINVQQSIDNIDLSPIENKIGNEELSVGDNITNAINILNNNAPMNVSYSGQKIFYGTTAYNQSLADSAFLLYTKTSSSSYIKIKGIPNIKNKTYLVYVIIYCTVYVNPDLSSYKTSEINISCIKQNYEIPEGSIELDLNNAIWPLRTWLMSYEKSSDTLSNTTYGNANTNVMSNAFLNGQYIYFISRSLGNAGFSAIRVTGSVIIPARLL